MASNSRSVVIATSGFRPTYGGKEPLFELVEMLRDRGVPTAGVISNNSPELERGCRERGLPWLRFPPAVLKGKKYLLEALRTDLDTRYLIKAFNDQVRELGGDFCLLYFAPWVPNSFQDLFPVGCANFHPGPLPQLRGFFPECFAILDGMTELGGTLHHITERFDEGPVFTYTKPVPVREWETPESLILRVSRAAVPQLASAIPDILDWTLKPRDQTGEVLRSCMHANLYPYSWADFETDTHLTLHRKFQVFRGQDAGMALKAEWDGRDFKILDWWLYGGEFPGLPGQVIGKVEGHPAVRTREGVCLITRFQPFLPDSLHHPNKESEGDSLVGDEPRQPPYSPRLLGSLRT